MLEIIKSIIEMLAPGIYRPDSAAARPDGGSKVLVVKDGYKVQELPIGIPAIPRRVHTFEDTGSLAQWLLRNSNPNTSEILADSEAGKIVACSSHSYESDVVSCPLQHSAAWKAWSQALQGPLSQEVLYRLVSTRRDEVKDALSVMALLADLDIKVSGEVKRKLGRSGVVELYSTENKTDIPINLPAELIVRMQVYVEGDTYDIILDILPEFTANRPPCFTLKARNADQARIAAFEAELVKLREALGEEWLVGRGKLIMSRSAAV